jgi:paraquat-inducible protein A
MNTAAELGLVACSSCDRISHLSALPAGSRARCPRCGAPLAHRKPDSLGRTWALLLAASLC